MKAQMLPSAMFRAALAILVAWSAALAHAQSPAAPASEIWIAPRRDGIAGTGAATDPFDGSSISKLGALMSAAPANCRIHFGAGAFPIENGTITLKDGQQLIGAGMDLTVFSMQNVVPGKGGIGYHACIKTAFTNYQSLLISDITCNGNASSFDASATGGNAFSVFGIEACGDNIAIERVRMTNMGGNKQEAFPISLSVIGANRPCHFLVRDSIVDATDLHSPGSTAIIFGRSSSTSGIPMDGDMSSHGEISNCSIKNGGYLGCAGFCNLTVSHCRVDNSGTGGLWGGFNSDTDNCSDVTIRGNTFITKGMYFNNSGVINIGAGTSAAFSRYKILDNHFYLAANGKYAGAVHANAKVVDMEMNGNVIDLLPGTSDSRPSLLRPLIIDNGNCAGFRVINNISDINYGPRDTALNPSFYACAYGNRHSDGAPTPYLPVISPRATDSR